MEKKVNKDLSDFRKYFKKSSIHIIRESDVKLWAEIYLRNKGNCFQTCDYKTTAKPKL